MCFNLLLICFPSASEEEQYTYIDTFNGGRFLAQGQCCSAFRIPSQLREGNLFEAISKNDVIILCYLLNVHAFCGHVG